MFGETPLLDAKGQVQYDKAGNLITKPNSLQSLLNNSGITGLAKSGLSSVSDYLKGFSGSNISGTAAAKDPYTGLPSGSLSGNSTADQESNQYFDLPAGVSPDGKGGYVNQYGDAVDANGTFKPDYTNYDQNYFTENPSFTGYSTPPADLNDPYYDYSI
jgi:hypothetical protein